MTSVVVKESGATRLKTVALSQVILIKDLTCLNDGRKTILASRSGNTGGVINLSLMSSAEGSMTTFAILTEQDSYHLLAMCYNICYN